jgi:cell division protein FtsW
MTSQINFKIYRKWAFYILVASFLFTLLVFVPHVGVSVGGAARWIYVGPMSVQPSELLKLAFVIYLAAWFSNSKNKAESLSRGFAPFAILTAVVGALLLKQPDTDTFLICVFAGLAIYLSAGGRWSHIFIIGAIGVAGLAVVAYERPYVMSRIQKLTVLQITISRGAREAQQPTGNLQPNGQEPRYFRQILIFSFL